MAFARQHFQNQIDGDLVVAEVVITAHHAVALLLELADFTQRVIQFADADYSRAGTR